MDELKKEQLFTDIGKNMLAEAGRLLNYISENMQGHVVNIEYADARESCVCDILKGENLMINITYIRFVEEPEITPTISISIFKIFEPGNFEVSVSADADEPLYALIPVSLINALDRSVVEKRSFEVTIGD